MNRVYRSLSLCVSALQEEFLKKNPNGINPVNANDVFFSLHALLLCLVYVIQAAAYEVGGCFIDLIFTQSQASLYKNIQCKWHLARVSSLLQRGGQKVSWTALLLLLIGWTFALVSLFIAVAKKITWLDYLYYFSYIKLAITLIKYIPQVSWGTADKETLEMQQGSSRLDLFVTTFSFSVLRL